MIWVIIIGGVVAICIIAIIQSNAATGAQKNMLQELNSCGLNITKEFTNKKVNLDGKNFVLGIDNCNRKICVLMNGYQRVFSYSDLMSVQIIENNEVSYNKSTIRTVGGTIVGGALLGGVGAVVGGLSGSSKKKEVIESLKVRLLIRDINSPTIDLYYVSNNKLNKTDPFYINYYLEPANELKNVLSIIIDDEDRRNKND